MSEFQEEYGCIKPVRWVIENSDDAYVVNLIYRPPNIDNAIPLTSNAFENIPVSKDFDPILSPDWVVRLVNYDKEERDSGRTQQESV
jgi:hypothetical protein